MPTFRTPAMDGFGAWDGTGLREEVAITRARIDTDFRERQAEMFGHDRSGGTY